VSHVHRCSGYPLSSIEVVRAEDCALYTADGREILDFEAGVWAASLGHNHPRIRRAMESQLDRISHMGYRISNPVQEEAATALLEIVGMPDGRCVYLSSGSEAVELGAKIARQVSGKQLLLTLEESFLGAYGSIGEKRPDEWAAFDRTVCRACLPERACDLSCPHLASIPFERIGAFVFEPGSSGGLVRFPEKELVRALCEGVRANNGLLMVNEVTTGMGRTGSWFAFQHLGLKPDIVASGKGLGSGYPVSAVAMTEDVAKVLDRSVFHYAQSHQNDPLGCRISLEVIRVMREEQLVEHCAEVGDLLREGLLELADRHDMAREARGRGLIQAIEFEPDRGGFSLPGLFGSLLDRGLLVGYKPVGNLLRFLPPLTISVSHIARLLEALDDALRTGS